MKAIVSHGIKDFRLQDRPIPEVGENDVLVRIEYCGICGTDIHQYHGTWELDIGSTPGHEASGVVKQIGQKVTSVDVGDRVAIDPGIYCNVCEYCRSERSHLCPNRFGMFHYKGGGFAEYTCVLDRQVFRLPDGMPLEWGAFLEPASCCVHGADRVQIRPGQTVAILGGGAIGLMLMQLALLSGATQVIVSEPQAKRREIAMQLGASATVDPVKDDGTQAIRELSNGGVDVVIESAGLPATVEQCFDVVKRGGKILLFGVTNPSTKVQFNPYQVFRNELTILGTVMSHDAFPRTLKLLATEKIKVQPLITHIKPLEQYLDALAMHQRQEGLKILISPLAGERIDSV
ncbi:MAG: zinc-dependent alcohol dehydrogenase family protein [Deltaproteobacteria bacterium]|nr:zinc-dependent alcohol dehydrogenase family protein [Deltaproteobacteria bacterium]